MYGVLGFVTARLMYGMCLVYDTLIRGKRFFIKRVVFFNSCFSFLKRERF